MIIYRWCAPFEGRTSVKFDKQMTSCEERASASESAIETETPRVLHLPLIFYKEKERA